MSVNDNFFKLGVFNDTCNSSFEIHFKINCDDFDIFLFSIINSCFNGVKFYARVSTTDDYQCFIDDHMEFEKVVKHLKSCGCEVF